MVSERASRHVFMGVSALLFAISTMATVAWCTSMPAMGGIPMPGGWALSMTWIRMPGQTWVSAATSFVAMWTVMMVAMMLPALVPMLLRYRVAVGRTGGTRVMWLTMLVAIGYFVVWTVFGAMIFPLGAALATAELRLPALARTVPYAVGVIVLVAGALQFTAWKAHHLDGWRGIVCDGRALSADGRSAWRFGVRLGLHCTCCCAGPTAVLLVIGVMDLRAMAVVTAAVVAERFAPAGERVARVLGGVAVGAGLVLIARAGGVG